MRGRHDPRREEGFTMPNQWCGGKIGGREMTDENVINTETDECSWCMALGHDWDTFGDGESCEMCGEKKPEKESAK